MSIVESVRTFASAYPPLADGQIHVGSTAIAYCIDEIETQPVLKRYVDGAALFQTTFALMSNEDLALEKMNALKASGFHDGFSDWLQEQTDKGALPKLENGIPQKIEAITNGYCVTSGEGINIPRYEMKFLLTYTK